jgi:hypothetical protein
MTNGIVSKKFLHNKGNNYQDEDTAYTMGEKSLPAVHQIKD